MVAILLSAIHALRPEESLALGLLPDGRLQVGEGERTAELAGDSRLLPGLVVLAWREEGQEGRTIRRVVWPDSLPAEDFRRLRVWLGRVA